MTEAELCAECARLQARMEVLIEASERLERILAENELRVRALELANAAQSTKFGAAERIIWIVLTAAVGILAARYGKYL